MAGCRLWYVTASARKTAAAAAADQQNNSVPVEIGYMNVIPKCLDSSGKYPVYENLPETYAAINSYLADSPLEGIYQIALCFYCPPRRRGTRICKREVMSKNYNKVISFTIFARNEN